MNPLDGGGTVLESVASGSGIEARYEGFTGVHVSGAEISHRAYEGDEAARKRFSDTDANIYEASFADGVGGSGDCFYAGLTKRDNFDGFVVFRAKSVNKNAAHKVLDWESMIDTSRVR